MRAYCTTSSGALRTKSPTELATIMGLVVWLAFDQRGHTPGMHLTSAARRTSAVLAVAGLSLGLASCSSYIDESKVESSIKSGAAAQLKIKVDSVDCPSDVEAKKGNTFMCTIKAEGDSAKIKVTQQDDEGSVRWELVKG